MSRVVTIIGTIKIDNLKLAQEAIKKSGVLGVKLVDNKFVFNQYDYYEGVGKKEEIEKVETIYNQLVEEAKKIHREKQREKIIENALKHGYKLKKEIQEDNTIKLVLQKRVY